MNLKEYNKFHEGRAGDFTIKPHQWKEYFRQQEIKQLKELAEKHGYKVVKNDD